MSEHTSLKGQVLIAMPSLHDPIFSKTVTLLCEHTAEGAMGIVINQPMSANLHQLFEGLNITPTAELPTTHLYQGGPVFPERGFVLHEKGGDWQRSIAIAEEVYLTTSKDLLEAIAQQHGPKHYLVALGCAGWGAGQLEKELANNAWLFGAMDAALLFNIPHQERWHYAAKHLGIDLDRISDSIGHA